MQPVITLPITDIRLGSPVILCARDFLRGISSHVRLWLETFEARRAPGEHRVTSVG